MRFTSLHATDKDSELQTQQALAGLTILKHDVPVIELDPVSKPKYEIRILGITSVGIHYSSPIGEKMN